LETNLPSAHQGFAESLLWSVLLSHPATLVPSGVVTASAESPSDPRSPHHLPAIPHACPAAGGPCRLARPRHPQPHAAYTGATLTPALPLLFTDFPSLTGLKWLHLFPQDIQ